MPEATTVGHGSYNVFYFPVKSTTSHSMANAQIDRLNRFGLGADLGFTPLYEIGRKVIMLQSKAESVDKPITLEIAESGSLRPWNLIFGKTYNNSSDIDQDDGEPTTCEGVLLVHKLNTARTSVIESHIIWKTVPESFSLSVPANINDRVSSSIRLMGEYWAMLGNGAGKGVVEWKTAAGSLLTLTSAPIERDDWPDDDDGSAVTESITGIVGKVCSVASTTGFEAGQLVKIAAHTGDDIITNGTFTGAITGWSGGANWTAVSDRAKHTAGATQALTQAAAVVVSGVSYTLTYDVAVRSAGTVTASCGGQSDTAKDADGSYTFTFTASATTALAFTPDTDFDGAIDNVTLESVSTDWETAIIDSVVLNTSITVRDTLKNEYAPSSVITRSMGTTFFVHNSTAGTWLYEGTDYIIYNTAGTVKAANISAGTDIGATDVCVIAYGIASASEEWTDNDVDLYRVLPSYVKAVVSASSDFSSSYELLRLQGLDMSVTFRRSRIDETGSKVPVERPYDGCETRVTLPGLDSDLTTFARLRNLTSTTQKVMTPEQSPAMYFRTEVYENSYRRAGDIKLCYEFPLVHQSAGEISDGANERGRKSNTLIGDTFAIATAL